MSDTILTFDCYGTLIDWETGIWNAFQPLLEGTDHSRSAVLSLFSAAESAQQAATPAMLYPDVLTHVHARVAEELSLSSTPLIDREFGSAVGDWPAFDDSHNALTELGSRNKLVILSNIDNTSFARSNERLGVAFDAVYTAEDIGSYKPNPANFEYMLEHVQSEFGAGPSDIVHVAQSLFHDHQQAISFGLKTVWIDRQRLSQGGDWGATARLAEMPQPDHVYFSMEEFASSGLV